MPYMSNLLLDTGFNWYAWVVLPLIICLARVADVSFGTVRIILVSKGYKLWAPVIGFFEILIWVTVIGRIFKDVNHPIYYIAYAGGFAIGNYVGMFIASKMSLGEVIIRVITKVPATELIEKLRDFGFNITSIPAEGPSGPVHLIFTIVPRKQLKNVVAQIKHYNPNALYSVEEVFFVNEGEFPLYRSLAKPAGKSLVGRGSKCK